MALILMLAFVAGVSMLSSATPSAQAHGCGLKVKIIPSSVKVGHPWGVTITWHPGPGLSVSYGAAQWSGNWITGAVRGSAAYPQAMLYTGNGSLWYWNFPRFIRGGTAVLTFTVWTVAPSNQSDFGSGCQETFTRTIKVSS